MIKKYIHNSTKHTLGFTFWLFGSDQYVIDYDTYKDEGDLSYYFRTSKADIAGINLERFVAFCDDNITSRTVLIDEASRKLKKLTVWRVNNKDNYPKFLNFVIEGKSMMQDLVNGLDGEAKNRAMMYYFILIEFATEEQDDSEKI